MLTLLDYYCFDIELCCFIQSLSKQPMDLVMLLDAVDNWTRLA